MRVEDYGNSGAKLELMTLSQIRKAAQNGPAEARVHVQVETASAKLTREQKPFCELALADAEDRMTLRVWSDHPEYKACGALQTNDFIELSGEFQQHQFGLDAKSWKVRALTPGEKQQLLQGPPELRAKQAADWDYILASTRAIGDIPPRMGRSVSTQRRREKLSSRPPRRFG
jgi:hypothetical protein